MNVNKSYLSIDPDFDIERENEINNWCLQRVGKEKFKKGSLRLERMLKDSIAEITSIRKIKIVTVAGTNGKGETAYALSYLLQNSGIHHALWISPHVMSIRERISVDGKLISYDKLKLLLESEYERSELLGEKISYYELLLCVFIKHVLSFEDNFLKVLVLEVGIGGRIDGVNLFDADLTAITSISRDHEDLLGVGYKNILMEKLGICRSKAPLITNFELKYLRELTSEYARNFCNECGEINCINWIDLFETGLLSREDNFSKRNRFLAFVLFKIIERNTDIANKAYIATNIANIADKTHQEYISLVDDIPYFKGRNEQITYQDNNSQFVFIGSHNLDGVRKLIHFAKDFDCALIALSKRSYEEEPFLIFKLFGKSISLAKNIYFTSFDHTKAFHFSSDFFKKFSDISGIEKNFVRYIEDWESFVTSKELQGKKVLVTGSYYFVGAVQTYLFKKKRANNISF
ncbi:MAG: hypothetical protein HQK51_11930 [Oligoflexia bacterium]|nr:hypothetical protein [Oligoflexia bacterium]